MSIRGLDHRQKKPDGQGQCLSERTQDAEATRERQEGREGSSGAPGQARAAGIGKDWGSEASRAPRVDEHAEERLKLSLNPS